MIVQKYIPERLYGFVGDVSSGQEVFFHLACFRPGDGETNLVRCLRCPGMPTCSTRSPPPPILGEEVEVAYEASDGTRAPRASMVTRLVTPRLILGVVESFDPARRYGFARGDDQVSYHLHQSEIADGRLPLAGQNTTFYAGLRAGRPRACHVRVCL